MALVSVVTPVYNGEAFLAQCIESVLAQSFSDWEYIIADNCSTDRSVEIAEEYARRDKRIRVVKARDFLPVNGSFNRAASLVSTGSRYLKYVCADDLLLPDCLRLMVAVAEANPSVRLVSAYKIWGQEPVCDGPPYPQEIVRGKQVCRWFFEGKMGVLGSETNHLIRLPAPSISGQLFDPSFVHSDIEFFIRLLNDDEADCGFVHQILTVSRIHGASVSSHAHLMGTGAVEYLAILRNRGRGFLPEHKWEQLVRRSRREHARFLLRAYLKFWNRSVWDYQVERARQLEIPLRLTDLLFAGFTEAISVAGAPKLAVQRIRREYSRVKAIGQR
jgi:glycosyltransferase involved in cell wall biosynthesis